MKLETIPLLLAMAFTATAGCDIDLGDIGGETDGDDDDDDDGDDGDTDAGGGQSGGESGSGGDDSDGASTGDTMTDESGGDSSGGADETGQPGNSTTAAGACEEVSTDCDTCLDCALTGGPCQAAFDACIDNLGCVELIGCYDGCALEVDESACTASCNAQYPEGVAEADLFLGCALGECGGLCE